MADLGAPLVAAISGVLGAAVGGGVTYAVARQQIQSARAAEEAAADRAALLRRRELYATFIATATQVVEAWLEVLGKPTDADGLMFADGRRIKAYDELQLLTAKVRIEASSGVLEAAELAIAELQALQAAGEAARKQGTAEDESTEWAERQAAFVTARDGFVEAIRSQRRAKPAAATTPG